MSEIYSPSSIAGPPATFMGPYNSGTAYPIGAAASSSGSTYVSLIAGNIGNDPSTSPTQWSMLAAQGSAGAPGTNGQVTNNALIAAVGLFSRTTDAGANQLNLATVATHFLLNGDGTQEANGDFATSGFILALGTRMIANFSLVADDRCVSCYDLTQVFIGHATLVGGGALLGASTGGLTPVGTVIQLVDGTAYVKCSILGVFGAPMMVVFGDAVHAPIMPGIYVCFTRDPSSVVDSKIAMAVGAVATSAGPQITASLPRGRNLYDVGVRSDGYFIDNSGTLAGAGAYTPLSTTGFIAVAGVGAIYCNAYVVDQSNHGSVAFYDANEQFLSAASGQVALGGGLPPRGFPPNTAIIVPSNAVYARLTTQFNGGDGTLGSAYVVPAAMMIMSGPTPGSYVSFGYDLPTVVDSKIAAAVAAATATIESQIAALGGGLGAVHENRPAQVGIVESGNVVAGGSQTLFSASGPGSIERIQLAFVNTLPTSAVLTEMEACMLTITVDGTVFTTTVGMFFLNIGISDAHPANEVFSTKWLERSLSQLQQQQGLGRRIHIPYQTSCSIVFTATTSMSIYTQVENYKGAPLPGLHSPNRKVFHMATTEWKDSAGLTPYQQIQLLLAPVAGPGVLEHWHIAGSCDARGIGNTPGWLEANPSITFDGTSFGAGGTEDFFGTQYYGTGLQTKADEFTFSVFTSAGTGLTYTLLSRNFDRFPLPFTTSLGPVTWSNGQGTQGVTPLPVMKCGMQIVWYTAT